MALLQISEPGMAPDPHQRRLAVGIDLGTTNSLVATVRSGEAQVLADEQGRALLPSVVRYAPDGRVQVGHDAQAHAVDDAENTISSVKRLMGRGAADAHAAQTPYRITPHAGMVRIGTRAGDKTPVEVSAEILRALAARARAALGMEPDESLAGAVVTVPAYFDDAQRQATKDAAQLAGLPVLRLLNEPTAAALAYGLDNASEGIYAVYDLGGGTFDVSILRMTKGVFEVIATGGDTALGGDDFDHALASDLEIEAQLDPPPTASDRRALQIAARAAKERLSGQPEAEVDVTLSDGRRVAQRVSAAHFETLTQPLVARTLAAVRNALRDANLAPADVQGVVLVGGATRMPHVRRAVQALFGKPPLTDLDPDQVVAVGAAIQADLLAGNRAAGDDWLLLDVIPLSLGLETLGGLVERIVPRNATIPVMRAQDFTTFKEGQTALAIHVVQGERELVSDCRSLARFELRGIPPMAAGAARIRVTFQVDADGLLSVTAREHSTGVQAQVAVKPSYGLTDDDIARMLGESFAHAEADMRARALREQQVEADRMIVATRNAIAADGDLLEPAERAAIEESIGCLVKLVRATGGGAGTGGASGSGGGAGKNAGAGASSGAGSGAGGSAAGAGTGGAGASGADHLAIKAAIDALARLTEPFAARRMDRAIQQALAGQRVDQVGGG